MFVISIIKSGTVDSCTGDQCSLTEKNIAVTPPTSDMEQVNIVVHINHRNSLPIGHLLRHMGVQEDGTNNVAVINNEIGAVSDSDDVVESSFDERIVELEEEEEEEKEKEKEEEEETQIDDTDDIWLLKESNPPKRSKFA